MFLVDFFCRNSYVPHFGNAHLVDPDLKIPKNNFNSRSQHALQFLVESWLHINLLHLNIATPAKALFILKMVFFLGTSPPSFGYSLPRTYQYIQEREASLYSKNVIQMEIP